ncbi:DUF6904 family protein (plasmid) [Acidithiobacillus ferriphilus]|uniref:DUF6904 family protein n=2 Tax=Acidithiobacillus ferriphilus TaxID=1689834 RepID=UPI002DBB988E|nr:hypothetical protein [Acidithiobacillus ferriphilus]MEB8475919.1 hypothetical protein [Acidithiobacillus ferriphilus]
MHPIGRPVDAWKDAETSEAGTRGDGYPVEEAPLTNYRDSAKSVTGESLSSAQSLHGKIHLHRATYQMRLHKMLGYKPTPKQAGIVLWGDFDTLRRLHEFIFRIIDGSELIEKKESFVLGLAYDVRKAYEGQRRKRLNVEAYDQEDRCMRYGVEILWPVLLAQVGMLRHAMAFMPTNKLDQSIMFELEFIVESAVHETMPRAADELIEQIQHVGSWPHAHIQELISSRSHYFTLLTPRERLKSLSPIMRTLDPLYENLYEIHPGLFPNAIPPNAFDNLADGDSTFQW